MTTTIDPPIIVNGENTTFEFSDSGNDLFKRLRYIPTQTDYWFVRTDGGIYFQNYIENNFIGIGWNEITYDDLRNKNHSEVKSKIAAVEKLDPTIVKSKSKISSIYNKLIRFQKIKNGDIIVIPSKGSSRLAFGKIEDETIYNEFEGTGNCEYIKRRQVKWLEIKDLDSLDDIFYEMKTNRHSISNIKKYQHYIDRVTSNFYFKDNSGTIVFEIDKEGDINVIELITFINQIQTLTTEINDYFGFGEDVSSNSIKLNLQSPGNFAITEKIGKSLAMLAILITLQGCGSSESINSQIPVGSNSKTPDDFIEKYRMELAKTQSTADTLKVNRDKIYRSTQLVDNN